MAIALIRTILEQGGKLTVFKFSNLNSVFKFCIATTSERIQVSRYLAYVRCKGSPCRVAEAHGSSISLTRYMNISSMPFGIRNEPPSPSVG